MAYSPSHYSARGGSFPVHGRFAGSQRQGAPIGASRKQRPDSPTRDSLHDISGKDLSLFLKLLLLSALVWGVGFFAKGVMPLIGGAVFAGYWVALMVCAFQGRMVPALCLMAYMAAIQGGLRIYVPQIPYLALAYSQIPAIILLVMSKRFPFRLTWPMLLYGLYALVEFMGLMSSYDFIYGRGVFIPSLMVFGYCLLAAKAVLTRPQFDALGLSYLVGALSTGVIVGLNFWLGDRISWTTESNSRFAAGMGPNQVTFLMALGAFLSLVFSERVRFLGKILFYSLCGLFIFFSIMTFSRGGLVLLFIALVAYLIFSYRFNWRSLLSLAVFSAIVYGMFVASANTTEGKIIERFSETRTSQRDVLAAKGWKMFEDNPLFGVGTGNYYIEVERYGFFAASGAHNEMVRAAAEHGLVGLGLWAFFVLFAFLSPFQGDRQEGAVKAVRIALFVMLIASTFYNGLKLMAQPLLVLLALCPVLPDKSNRPQPAANRSRPRSARNRVRPLQAAPAHDSRHRSLPAASPILSTGGSDGNSASQPFTATP